MVRKQARLLTRRSREDHEDARRKEFPATLRLRRAWYTARRPGSPLREPSWFFVPFVLKTDLLAVYRAPPCAKPLRRRQAGEGRQAKAGQPADRPEYVRRPGLAPFCSGSSGLGAYQPTHERPYTESMVAKPSGRDDLVSATAGNGSRSGPRIVRKQARLLTRRCREDHEDARRKEFPAALRLRRAWYTARRPGSPLREPSWFFVPFVLKTDLLAVYQAGARLRETASARAGHPADRPEYVRRPGLAPFLFRFIRLRQQANFDRGHPLAAQ
jgi:hypothetical protein